MLCILSGVPKKLPWPEDIYFKACCVILLSTCFLYSSSPPQRLFKTFINRYITLLFTWRIQYTSRAAGQGSADGPPCKMYSVMYLFIKVLKNLCGGVRPWSSTGQTGVR